MIVDTEEYAEMTGLKPGSVRMAISRAKGNALLAGLVGVIDAKKMGNSWVFMIDAKVIEDNRKKDLEDS